jgi:hypothetical protein
LKEELLYEIVKERGVSKENRGASAPHFHCRQSIKPMQPSCLLLFVVYSLPGDSAHECETKRLPLREIGSREKEYKDF